MRVRLSNAFGMEPVEIGAAHLAVSASGSGVARASDRTLTFCGHSHVTIPTGAVIISDPAQLKIAPAANLSISIYLPKDAVGGGIHDAAQQTNYIATGDATAAASFDSPASMTSRVFLTGLDVLAPADARSIIAFGASITGQVLTLFISVTGRFG